jgi:hypothetical protein
MNLRHPLRNVPETWVTLWAERIFERLKHSGLQIEVSQIIIHETDQPDVVVDFFDDDGVSCEDLAEIDLL